QSFIEHDAFQCGYCTPGQICSAAGMLREVEAGWPSAVSADLNAEHVTLSEDEIRERMSGNLCRCAAYANIVPAIAEVLPIRSPDAERRSYSFVGDRNKEVKRSNLSATNVQVTPPLPWRCLPRHLRASSLEAGQTSST